MKHGLTVITDQGAIEVPQDIEAGGGAAIDAYVAVELARRAAETPAAPQEGV